MAQPLRSYPTTPARGRPTMRSPARRPPPRRVADEIVRSEIRLGFRYDQRLLTFPNSAHHRLAEKAARNMLGLSCAVADSREPPRCRCTLGGILLPRLGPAELPGSDVEHVSELRRRHAESPGEKRAEVAVRKPHGLRHLAD